MVEIHAALLGHLPPAFKVLLLMRSALVRPFGIRSVSYGELAASIDTDRKFVQGDKIGRWIIFSQDEDELITGADDRHLDFRVSVMRQRGTRVVLSTAVMTHNAVGRGYLSLILPFHRYGVAKLVSNASAAGRI